MKNQVSEGLNFKLNIDLSQIEESERVSNQPSLEMFDTLMKNGYNFMIQRKTNSKKEGQYLEDVMKEIPTDTILSKTLPGLGANTLEIKSKRNSIIIEPNVPVPSDTSISKHQCVG